MSLIYKQFSLVVLASYAFESVTSVLPRADLRLLRRGPRGCFRSECRICREPMAASVSLHPTINTEQEAGQAASTVCQVFRLTRTGFETQPTSLMAPAQPTVLPNPFLIGQNMYQNMGNFVGLNSGNNCSFRDGWNNLIIS